MVLRVRDAVARRAGTAYLTGSSLTAAVDTADALHLRGESATLSYWNAEHDSPETVAEQCLALAAAAAPRAAWCDVAVKLPALALHRGRADAVAAAARDLGVRLWFDAHSPSVADATLRQAHRAAAVGSAVGVALPARWARTREDAVAAAGGGLAVRLVKGQWSEGEVTPDELRGRMIDLVRLVAGRGPLVGVATHDETVLAEACVALQEAGAPFEVQLMHGLPTRRARDVVSRYRAPVRVYLPYGHPSLPYSLRDVRAGRRPAGWFLEDLLLGPRKSVVLDRRRR